MWIFNKRYYIYNYYFITYTFYYFTRKKKGNNQEESRTIFEIPRINSQTNVIIPRDFNDNVTVEAVPVKN